MTQNQQTRNQQIQSQHKPMAQHQHNPLIRTVYGALVIVMFSFFILLVRQYGQPDTRLDDNRENKPVKPKATLTQFVPAFFISGKTYRLDLNHSLEQQVNQAWQDFFNIDLNIFANQTEIYAGFYDYSATKNHVNFILGFANQNSEPFASGFTSVPMPAGQYWKTDSVLKAWNDPNVLPAQLSYQGNYEVYKINRQFDLLSQTAYLHVLEE